MKRMRHLWYIVVAMLMVVALVPSCTPPVVEEELPPIKIGHLAELTGVEAGAGELFSEGVRLRLDEAGWEVAGRKIELITEDAADNPTVAVDKARKLAEVDKVDVVIGPLMSHCGAAVADYLLPKKTLNIAECNHGFEIGLNENLLMPMGALIGQEIGFGHFAYEKLGARTAATLGADYAAGQRFSESFKVGFERAGGTVIKSMLVPMGEMDDFVPYLANLGNPDVLFRFGPGQASALLFGTQFYESGLEEIELLLGCCYVPEPIMPELGDKILGAYGTTFYTWMIDSPANEHFVEAFKATYDGRLPTAFAAAGWTSTSVFLEAVKATGGDTTYEKLLQAALGLRLDMPGGVIEFGSDGIGVPTMYVCKAVKVDGIYAWEVVDSYPSRIPEGWSPE